MHEHRFVGSFDRCKIAANRLACIEYALPCSHREVPRCESMEGCCENKAMGMENTPAGTENGVACIENVEAGRENRPPCIDNMEACIENKEARVDYMEARSENRDPRINDMDSRGSHYWLRFADALPVSPGRNRDRATIRSRVQSVFPAADAVVAEETVNHRNPRSTVRRRTVLDCPGQRRTAGWCERGDSNSHTFRRVDLNHLRLPISPRSHRR